MSAPFKLSGKMVAQNAALFAIHGSKPEHCAALLCRPDRHPSDAGTDHYQITSGFKPANWIGHCSLSQAQSQWGAPYKAQLAGCPFRIYAI
jgi:hypothetical protein